MAPQGSYHNITEQGSYHKITDTREKGYEVTSTTALPSNEREITRKIEELTMNCEKLAVTIDELGSRLTVVSRLGKDLKEQPQPTATQTKIGLDIETANTHIAYLTSKVVRMIESLEI